MKTYIQEVLRWATIAVFGGFGAWVLYTGGQCVVRNWDDGWFSTLFVIFISLLISLPFLAVAYFCLQRQYRKIFLVVGVIGCIPVCFVLMSLPDKFGWFEFIDRHEPGSGLSLLALPLVILFIFGPIYAAAWFFRLCRYLAYRGTESNEPWQKTRDTGWLVGLGLCLLFAPLIAMLYHFNIMVHPPSPPSSLESVDNWINWSMGLISLGVVMMIVGLVWRRPIVEQQKEPLSTNGESQSEADKFAVTNESQALLEQEGTEKTEFGKN